MSQYKIIRTRRTEYNFPHLHIKQNVNMNKNTLQGKLFLIITLRVSLILQQNFANHEIPTNNKP